MKCLSTSCGNLPPHFDKNKKILEYVTSFFAQTKFLRINYAQLMCTFCSAHANQEYLVTTMMALFFRPSSVSMATSMELHSTTLFVLDPSFWGHKGVPTC